MAWALVALIGYFFNAVAAVFDKYLLSGRVPAPSAYAFFVSLFSLFALGFVPFGCTIPDARTLFVLLASGIIFVYGLIAFYIAVKRHEVSRVTPLVGLFTSLVAFLSLFLPSAADETMINTYFIGALIFLIIGGLLISFDLPLRHGEHISRFVVIAGVSFGISFVLLKNGYVGTNFISGLVWSRMGMVLAGASLFLIPRYRKEIVTQFSRLHPKEKGASSTSTLLVLSKATAGVATLLIAYATYLGSVSFVQALSGMQYLFLLIMTFPLAYFYPRIYGEKLFFWDWVQKFFAIILIGVGLWLAARSGIRLSLP